MGIQYQPTYDDIKSWMRMTDTNGDGKVSLEEYEDLVIRSLQHAGIKLDWFIIILLLLKYKKKYFNQ